MDYTIPQGKQNAAKGRIFNAAYLLLLLMLLFLVFYIVCSIINVQETCNTVS